MKQCSQTGCCPQLESPDDTTADKITAASRIHHVPTLCSFSSDLVLCAGGCTSPFCSACRHFHQNSTKSLNSQSAWQPPALHSHPKASTHPSDTPHSRQLSCRHRGSLLLFRVPLALSFKRNSPHGSSQQTKEAAATPITHTAQQARGGGGP